MYIKFLSFALLLAVALLQFTTVQADLEIRAAKKCKSVTTDFRKTHKGWKSLDSSKTYKFTKNGLELKLHKPKKYVRKIDNASNLPYNVYPGEGSTFNYTSYLQYGSFSATMKPATVGGAVTAFIGIGDGADEIDFEFLGGNSQNIQSNYFYGKNIVYGANGGVHPLPGNVLPGSAYHKYSIDWSPSEIKWSIDGKVVRTKTRASTRNYKGQYEYPTQPMRIQLGLWDGSTSPGTAQWANGPINWSKQKSPITAYIRSVSITCSK